MRRAVALFFALLAGALAAEPAGLFEIQVVDAATQRGVPLVELVTTDAVRFVTDSAGRIAYDEAGHAGETIFFEVRPQGYRVPKDGFGVEGVRVKVEPGKVHTIVLERINVAERLYRTTGAGIYRDSLLLGHEAPAREALGAGRVAGQDSVQVAEYRGKLHWFWGDTSRLSYPLGLFRTAGAVSAPASELDPAQSVALRYFTGEDGFVRAMAEAKDPKGVIWIDGVCTVPDSVGGERMVARFSRREGLGELYEHGLALWDDAREIFSPRTTLPREETWRFLREHPVRVREGETEYLMCGNPFLTTRVPAVLEAVLDPARYESWSCADAAGKPRRDASGALNWRWQATAPTTQTDEARWLKEKVIRAEETRFLPEDTAASGRRVTLHGGTIRWNAHRERWVMLAVEIAGKGSPSHLGEVWVSEAASPQGPWARAVRVVTHDQQSFYNPCHHAFFDRSGGREIFFEGTYTNTFTAAPPTPRYNYNQVMYRLDLDHPALVRAFPRAKK